MCESTNWKRNEKTKVLSALLMLDNWIEFSDSLKIVTICSICCRYRSLTARRALMHFNYVPLRTRRALMIFNDVPLTTRRVLSLYKVYGDSALLVLNGASLNIINTLLALNWCWSIWFPYLFLLYIFILLVLCSFHLCKKKLFSSQNYCF